jgi:hypothetical protein
MDKKSAIDVKATEAGTPPTEAGADNKPTSQLLVEGNSSSGPTRRSSRFPPKVNAWAILFGHLGASLAVALSIALAVNGYRALDDSSASHASYVGGRLVLRVGDVTTLISAALVVVKLLVGSWTTLAVWACGHYLLFRAPLPATAPQHKEQPSTPTARAAKDVGWMMRWKLPPWLRPPFRIPASPRHWIITFSLIIIAVQAFIAPILTGAVNWTSTPVPQPDETVAVAAVDSKANFGSWKWYNYPFEPAGLPRKPYLRMAAGYASMAWSDPALLSANGTSTTGNGCRHVVAADNALGPNATLLDAVLPCIRFDGIEWHKANDEVPKVEWVYVADSSSLSIVDDSPSTYYVAGATVVFDTVVGRNKSQSWDVKPAPIIFNKPQVVGIMVKRVEAQEPRCSVLDPTIFGDVDGLDRYRLAWGDGTNDNCFFIGTIKFTAGVTVSPRSRYISGRVVEDQTPLDEVEFVENPWVQEAIWMLPDLMTMITVMNSTLLPTYDNLDRYVELLVRQAYLAAWDMYHDSFDEDQKGSVYTGIPTVSRQVAGVSFARVFAWLALNALVTLSGGLLLAVVLRADDLKVPEGDALDARAERREEGQGGVYDMLMSMFCG